MDNKKVLIVSIAAVAVLVISIIATSYAVFTANLTGTKNNALTTGYVTLNCAETSFSLTNTNIMTDAQGTSASGNSATCTLTSTMQGEMRVGYDIGLTAVTPSTNITTSNVKINVSKAVDSATATYPVGSASTGVTVASLASAAGTYDSTGIPSYKLDTDVISGNHSIVYTIKGWLASGGNGTATTSSATGVCSDTTYTTESTCEAAGGIWGDKQTSSSAGGTFSFKLKLGATQVFPTTAS